MDKEQADNGTNELHENPIPGGIIFENHSEFKAVRKDGIDQILYDRVKLRALEDIPELQNPHLLQKVEDEMIKMMGAYSIDRANALLDLADRHRPETTSMLYGFVRKVKKDEDQ